MGVGCASHYLSWRPRPHRTSQQRGSRGCPVQHIASSRGDGREGEGSQWSRLHLYHLPQCQGRAAPGAVAGTRGGPRLVGRQHERKLYRPERPRCHQGNAAFLLTTPSSCCVAVVNESIRSVLLVKKLYREALPSLLLTQVNTLFVLLIVVICIELKFIFYMPTNLPLLLIR